MAHQTPQFNVKTGADSSLFFSRETTSADKTAGIIDDDEKVGLIQSEVPDAVFDTKKANPATGSKGEYVDPIDYFSYPALTRRTGHSITGSTDNIESNELRKGRTKSAPRKGRSSATGDLEFELSPETYDDILEAAFRGRWTNWVSDTNSASNIVKAGEIKPEYEDGLFATAIGDPLAKKGIEHPAIKLLGTEAEVRAGLALVATNEEVEIHELCCGTEDIKYSALAQYGGITGEDLFQEFQHLAVNTMALSVSPGEIVTGSFGFQGSNDPDLVQAGEDYTLADPQPTADNFAKGVYYTMDDTTGTAVYTRATAHTTGAKYYVKPTGLIHNLAEHDGHQGRFLNQMTPAEVKEWIKNLPEKGTSTDQYTAREGFLYIAGKRVQFGSNLTFNLDNGLKQLFAIFERDAISTAPMTLDITGTLDAYLIKDHAEVLYNLATQDKDVEVLFCFQDREDDPTALYVMQIFKTKFDKSISQGSEELTVSLPYTSFEEKAARMFRIRRRKPIKVTFSSEGEITCELSTVKEGVKASDFKFSWVVAGKEPVAEPSVSWGGLIEGENKTFKWTCNPSTNGFSGKTVALTIEYNGNKKTISRKFA